MNAPDKTARVFIAIEPPEEAKVALANAIQELEQVIPSGVRWVRPNGIHLTLKFLGDVQAPVLDDILDALEWATRDFSGEKFRLGLSNLGMFPNPRQPRVLWAGVQGDLDSLQKLQTAVDVATSRLGFSPEKGAFRPHLTLGRVQDRVAQGVRRYIGEAVSRKEPLPSIGWEVKAIHLIQSDLQPGGAIYTSMGSSSL